MISSATTVTTTAQRIVAKSNSSRTVYIHVEGNGTVYLGGSTVSSVNGLETQKNAIPLTLEIPAQEELWAVTASGTQSLRLLLPDLYNQ